MPGGIQNMVGGIEPMQVNIFLMISNEDIRRQKKHGHKVGKVGGKKAQIRIQDGKLNKPN
jgi:hypothetical protein